MTRLVWLVAVESSLTTEQLDCFLIVSEEVKLRVENLQRNSQRENERERERVLSLSDLSSTLEMEREEELTVLIRLSSKVLRLCYTAGSRYCLISIFFLPS